MGSSDEEWLTLTMCSLGARHCVRALYQSIFAITHQGSDEETKAQSGKVTAQLSQVRMLHQET